jgi:5-formyltetrahydrofolate cyclo-ligase
MTVAQPDPAASKDVWRQWARQVRSDLDWDVLSEAVINGVRAWLLPDDVPTVLVYMAMGDEINLQALIESEAGIRFVASRTPDRGGELSVHELGGPLEVHRMGFLQPHSSARVVSPDEIDVALLPGLAFDLFGNRLGRGAGYFDRLLRATRPNARLVGVAPVELIVDRLPNESHDIAVSLLATEEGVIETA